MPVTMPTRLGRPFLSHSIAIQTSDAVAAADAVAENNVHELKDIVAGKAPGRTSDDQITLFKSVGTGIQDIALASVIYQKALDAGLGTDLGQFPFLKRSK